jgi:hypothetical protein
VTKLTDPGALPPRRRGHGAGRPARAAGVGAAFRRGAGRLGRSYRVEPLAPDPRTPGGAGRARPGGRVPRRACDGRGALDADGHRGIDGGRRAALDALEAAGEVDPVPHDTRPTSPRLHLRVLSDSARRAAGWEAAVFDHFQAVVATLCARIALGPAAHARHGRDGRQHLQLRSCGGAPPGGRGPRPAPRDARADCRRCARRSTRTPARLGRLDRGGGSRQDHVLLRPDGPGGRGLGEGPACPEAINWRSAGLGRPCATRPAGRPRPRPGHAGR